MKKIIFLLPALLLFSVSLYAQEAKKGCNPSACSPGNTKVAEAIVITSLREDLETLKSDIQANGVELPAITVPKGKDDHESLGIISKEVNEIEQLLQEQKTDFSGLHGARLVKKIETALLNLKTE